MLPSDNRDAIPVVFISSTVKDLRPYRFAAENAAKIATFFPLMQDYFVTRGDNPPFEECLRKVSKADVLVVIVAHRYGWIPEDPSNTGKKSITWLECERAVETGKEVLAFVVDEQYAWPIDLREEYRLVTAVREGMAEVVVRDVQCRVSQLKAFKEWLRSRFIRAEFTSPEDLRGKISDALHQWRSRRLPHVSVEASRSSRDADPTAYLHAVAQDTAYIDIRGLEVGEGRAHRFPIDDLFIDLTSDRALEESMGESWPTVNGRRASLEQALSSPKLTIVGDPGSGKTTFLRYIAHAFAQTLLGKPDAATKVLGVVGCRFPMFVRMGDLISYIVYQHARPALSGPSSIDSPAWLGRFFGTKSIELNWGVDREFFCAQLEAGMCIVLFDGLDEAPDRKWREAMSNLIQQTARVYNGNHFVVTGRPQAYGGKSALPGPEFDQVRIGDLEWEAVESFLTRWSAALFMGNPAQAEAHRRQLIEAVGSRSAIRRLARNPVMLTALAVLHWNNRRLPEQRAELYESVIKWLSQSRENREGRATAERCVALLQDLAKAMQDHPDGRQVQVPRQWAAKVLAVRFREAHQEERVEAAERFLREEEIDSGIVVSRGSDIRFWHLTFQEYLAARAISGLPDAEQHQLLLRKGKAYLPEWREVVFLIAGVLHQQGIRKVDALFSAILNDLEVHSPDRFWQKLRGGKVEMDIAAKARAAGLLGGILMDLGPLRYRSTDPRHEANLLEILRVFEADESRAVELKVRLEAAEALGRAGDPRLSGDNWVSIERGAGDSSDGPRAVVTAFSIGRYPVTVEEYRRFVEDGGYEDRRWWGNGWSVRHGLPDNWDEQVQHGNWPVVGVSWYEAMAYCEWQGVQLQGEAEWEVAAHGAGGGNYPWGDRRPDPTVANYCENHLGHPTPVGLYPLGATPHGIHDLAGNVWEWTRDWFKKGDSRVVRGGAWNVNAWLLKNTVRCGLAPGNRRANVGFRVQK